MTKRKAVSTARAAKKFKSSVKGLNKTNYTGDIVPANLHSFGAKAIAPTRSTKAILRYATSSFNGGVVAGVGYALSFQLSSAVNAADYTNLYDQYRIVAVEVTMMPAFSQVNVVAATQGRLFTAIDYDDAATPSGPNVLRPYQNCMITNPWEKCVRTLVPRAADALYSGAFTSFGQQKMPWIDSASPSVQHYALKAWVENSTTVPSIFYIEVKMFCEFKSIRAL